MPINTQAGRTPSFAMRHSSCGKTVMKYSNTLMTTAESPSLAMRDSAWRRCGAGPLIKRLSALIAESRPHVVHFHNTFPLISPSAYYAARKHGVPVVQTLHNFRLLCANAIFMRDGRPCEDCLPRRVPFAGVLHKCYRDSRTASAGVAAMVTLHRALGTWRNLIDVYIALSEFARDKFVAGGLPQHKIVVKPNCLTDDPALGLGQRAFALFVGRLSPEKGIAATGLCLGEDRRPIADQDCWRGTGSEPCEGGCPRVCGHRVSGRRTAGASTFIA